MPYDSNLVSYAQATIAVISGQCHMTHVWWHARSCHHMTVWSIVERSFKQHSSTHKINSWRCMAWKKDGTLSLGGTGQHRCNAAVELNKIRPLHKSMLWMGNSLLKYCTVYSPNHIPTMHCVTKVITSQWGNFLLNKHVLYPQSQLHSGSDRSLQTRPTLIIS